MVAPKGKVTMGVNRLTGDSRPQRTVAVGNFKVYSDNGKVKVDASGKRKSGPVNKVDPVITGSSKVVEKINNKNNSSEYQGVRRKALTDVSNVRNNFSRNAVLDGSKPMFSAGSSSKNVNISLRKSSMGKVRNDSDKNATELNNAKRGVRNMRASLDDQRTINKNPSRESVINNGRRNARNSFIPTRKSLPVLKKTNHTDTSNAKENDENSKKANQVSGFPVKSQVKKKVVSHMSIGRGHLWGNIVSDGYIVMATRDQTNVDTRALSRKNIKPIVKTTIKVSNADKTTGFKIMSSMKKPITAAAVPSKKKDKAVVASPPDNMSAVVSQEVTQEASTDDNTLSTKKLDVNARRKSDRRRSYTSLLMSRSKLIEEHGEVIDLEKLQSIDDNCNQLEVAEYVDEIYQYYWVLEAQNPSLENYLSIQTDIIPQLRGILINWLVEVHSKFELMQETLYLMVTLFDRYLSQVQIRKSEMQLVGLTALLLASKYEDFWHPKVKDLISISAESYTRHQMLAMEKLILKKLKFRLNEPTPYVFMLRFLKAAQSDMKLEHMAFYLIELCLVEYEALKFKPSLLCASAIYVARSTLQITPPWTPLLAKHSRYEVSHIRDCAELILRFHKAARKAKLRVSYEKYMTPDVSSVAAIKPLDKLPL